MKVSVYVTQQYEHGQLGNIEKPLVEDELPETVGISLMEEIHAKVHETIQRYKKLKT
jgi:hypothetical protein